MFICKPTTIWHCCENPLLGALFEEHSVVSQMCLKILENDDKYIRTMRVKQIPYENKFIL